MSVIQVSVNQNQIAINPQHLEEKAERILNALGYTDVELSILIVDDQEMADMNRQYRHIDSTTDVLSFPMWEGEFGDVCMDLLGDVVISAPTAQLMAVEHQMPFPAVLDLLLVHGILHLVGHDHERGEEAAREMEARSMDLLHMLGHAEESFGWYLKPGEGPVQSA